MICPFPASHPPSRVVASWGQGPLPGTFPASLPSSQHRARHEADDQCYGVKNQTCHCTNENAAQKAVGREDILLAFTISRQTPSLHKIPSRLHPAQEFCSFQSQARPWHSALVSPAPWSQLTARPGAKAGSGPWQLAALALGFSEPSWNPGTALSFLDNMGRAGHLFVPQFPHLVSGNNAMPQRVIRRVWKVLIVVPKRVFAL